MSLRCRFILPNWEYSEDYAREHHNGEESDDNYKFIWEDEFDFTGNIDSIELTEMTTYPIRGEKDGEKFEFEIPRMKIWRISGENENIIAVSENALDTVEFNKEEFTVHFKKKSVLSNMIPGVYIDVDDFPKELIP